MGISRSEAASALTDIESAAGRSRLLKGYHYAAPILMVWGLVWAAGYTGMGLLAPDRWGLVWLVLDVIGVVSTILLVRRGKGQAKAGKTWKILAAIFVILIFYGGTFALFRPDSTDPAIAYPGLVTGLVYAGVGIAFAPRYLWIGAALFAASLVGFFFFQPWLAFWMAMAGGGSLFVSGLWLRRA